MCDMCSKNYAGGNSKIQSIQEQMPDYNGGSGNPYSSGNNEENM